VQTDWQTWQKRDLAKDDIVCLIRWHGGAGSPRQARNRAVGGGRPRPGRLTRPPGRARARGLGGTPQLTVIDGAPDLEATLAALYRSSATHKHRSQFAHAPKKLHDELSADYAEMSYANTVTKAAWP
jgi:hypothetical protein